MRLIQKFINSPKGKKIFKKVKNKNTVTTKTSTIKNKTNTVKNKTNTIKTNTKKGISLLNQFNLLKKIKTDKKTLLG